MKMNLTDRYEGIDGLLEHIEILKDNILSIKAPSSLSLENMENSKEAIIEIRKLQEQVIQYQKTAQVLRESIEKHIYTI